jgi:DNA repair exonuclease SbcCD ATPase subunit
MGVLENLAEQISSALSRLDALEKSAPDLRFSEIDANIDERAQALVKSMLDVSAKTDTTDSQLQQFSKSICAQLDAVNKGIKSIEDVVQVIGRRVDNLDRQMREASQARSQVPLAKETAIEPPARKKEARCPTCAAKPPGGILYTKAGMKVCGKCSPASAIN